uniref:Uncharacterized protein n=1 Tax=Anguilla anguilla TaxID=7936 RepID=A0A0E9RAP9_ANGAN
MRCAHRGWFTVSDFLWLNFQPASCLAKLN